MGKEHVISDKLMREINDALNSGENWMAYHTGLYYLETGNAYFFKDKEEANEFGPVH